MFYRGCSQVRYRHQPFPAHLRPEGGGVGEQPEGAVGQGQRETAVYVCVGGEGGKVGIEMSLILLGLSMELTKLIMKHISW